MKYVVIGTAGHIDHGKTALIKALTGIDTDRLPEEKRRGITIDLGFAHYQLTPNINASFVDVPGHERLVKNMIAGASGIDMVLMVIAADEGIMPQTVEHTYICEILGIKYGVIAITKKDLVDEDTLEIVKEEVKNFFKQRSLLKDAPIVAVSAKTGEGLEKLVKAIEEVALLIPEKKGITPFRLPIDRVFSVKGFGTVVTGTVASGEIKVGDDVVILPHEKKAKVRNIQVQGKNAQISKIGERCALNLQGIEKGEIKRGDIIASEGAFKPTTMLDVKVFLIDSKAILKDLHPVRIHISTKEAIGRIKLLETEEIKGPCTAFCRIHFEEKVVAANAMPIVIRSYSPVTTIGGGIILDACPEKKRIKRKALIERLKELDKADETKRLELFIKWKPEGIRLEELKYKAIDPYKTREIVKNLLSKGKIIELGENLYIHKEHLKEWESIIKNEIKNYMRENPLRAGIPLKELAQKIWKHDVNTLDKFLNFFQNIERKGNLVCVQEIKTSVNPEIAQLISQVENEFIKLKFNPPKIEETFKNLNIPSKVRQQIIRYLIENKLLIRISADILLHKNYVNEMINKVEKFFENNEELTVSQFKDMFGISRKYAIPYLEYLDRIGITKRVGNVRRRR